MIKLSEEQKARIAHELASLPSLMGKIIMTCEFNCGTGGTVELTIKKYSEERDPCKQDGRRINVA